MSAWNPDDKHQFITLSGSNRIVTSTTDNNWKSLRAVGGRNTATGGRWAFGVRLETGGATPNAQIFGFVLSTMVLADQYIHVGQGTGGGYGYGNGAYKWWNSVLDNYGSASVTGDYVLCVLDCDTRAVKFYRNDADLGVAFTNIPAAVYYPAASLYSNGAQCTGYFRWQDWPYALPTGVNMWGDTGEATVATRHRSAFGIFFSVATAHQAGFGGLVGARHRGSYAARLTVAHRAGFGSLVGARHLSAEAVRVAVAKQSAFRHGISTSKHAAFAAYAPQATRYRHAFSAQLYTPLAFNRHSGASVILARTYRTGASALFDLAFSHSSGHTASSELALSRHASYAALTRNQVQIQHRAAFVARAPQDQVMTDSARLWPVGTGEQPIPLESARLSCDVGSPYWQADVTLARARDVARCRLDALVDLEIGARRYRLLIDDRQLTRGRDARGHPQESATLKCLSPGVRYDHPRAELITRTWDEPQKAQSIIEEVLDQSVDWQIYDWTIPKNRLAVTDASPLSIAKQVVEAMGGLLESLPDGTLRARYRFPTKVADLYRVTPDLTLYDSDLYSVQETRSRSQLIDRIRLVDVEAVYSDKLEFSPDETDGRRGIVRAYPSPWRDALVITHTRNGPVHLYDRAVELLSKSETIEVISGAANVSYPILNIQLTQYLSENLGAVHFAPYSTQITTAKSGYSLLVITYTTKALTYRVESQIDTEAQTLLEDRS